MLRLLRGKSLDLLAREAGQPTERIAGWREEFLEAGREGLKSRPRPERDRRLLAAQRKVGGLQLEVNILRALLEKKPSVTEALEVTVQLPAPLKTVCRVRACPGRRRRSSAPRAVIRARRPRLERGLVRRRPPNGPLCRRRRYDGGSCFRCEHYQAEIDHLGIAPAFHTNRRRTAAPRKAIQVLKERTRVEAREHWAPRRPPRHDQLVHWRVRPTGAGALGGNVGGNGDTET